MSVSICRRHPALVAGAVLAAAAFGACASPAAAQVATQQAPPSGLVLERKGSLGPFTLGERATAYMQYLAALEGEVGTYLSSDSLFLVRVNTAGRIIAVESSSSAVLTTRMIRPGISSMRDVLDLYGTPAHVRTDRDGLVLAHDRLEFVFDTRPSTSLSDTQFTELLQIQVKTIRLVAEGRAR